MIRYWFFTRTQLHRLVDAARADAAELARRVRALETENTARTGGEYKLRGEIRRLTETNRALEERLATLQEANMARDRAPR
ncbi:hypothetical protein [Microbispora sp. NPDC049633]|uniref:hypothetical protein n=1 Tax=Microbispora sp. NPDC049633 TaxID=3154355 RepID=UPI0034173432